MKTGEVSYARPGSTCYVSTWKVKAGRSKIQGHSPAAI